MKPTSVDKLIDQLADLKVEERELLRRLEENRQKQSEIKSGVQLKSDVADTATASAATSRRPALKHARRALALRETTRPRPVVRATSTQTPKAKPDSERIRDYIIAAADDATITTEEVAEKLNIKPSTASTTLSRMTGKLIERVPGTKRGKFRKIARAA